MNPFNYGSNSQKMDGPGGRGGGGRGGMGGRGPNPWQSAGPDPRNDFDGRRGGGGRVGPGGPISPNMRGNDRMQPGPYPPGGGGGFNRGPPRGGGNFGPREPQPQYKEDVPTPNDCEIITVLSPDPAYVSMVENAIKDLHLKVDVMIPKATVKISTLIENLANRGTIFAVIIRPDNVEHRSVSVHVLRGPPKPEEHRNMPLSSAYNLISKSYQDLQKKDIGVPEPIKNLLRYTIDDRSLTDNEYATVINFLQERRKRQFGLGEPAILSQEELQQKILTIINGDKSSSAEPSSGPTVIDHDHQNLQQVIGNLLSNPNVLQNLGGGQSNRPFNM